MKSDFLESLTNVDVHAEWVGVAQQFLDHKGYPGIEPLGFVDLGSGDAWYVYYQLPEGILEVEVTMDASTGQYGRSVSSFITEAAEVERLLGT